MNLNYDLQAVIPGLLSAVPELAPAYLQLQKEEQESAQRLSPKDIDELDQITKMHGLPKRDYNQPGVTIVFEQLLVRFMLELTEKCTPLHRHRLKEIMDWVEELAGHAEFAVRNLIAGSVCEPLITTHEANLRYFVPLMGEKTKALCTMQFEMYRINDETKRLFGVK